MSSRAAVHGVSPCGRTSLPFMAAAPSTALSCCRMGSNSNADAATIANAIAEGSAGVGLLARGSADAAGTCPGAVAAGCVDYVPVAISYSLAAFMIARTSAYSYFGYSSGWFSQCWCWHGEYDAAAACGEPAAPAVRLSAYVWTRQYADCSVMVDTLNATGIISPRQQL